MTMTSIFSSIPSTKHTSYTVLANGFVYKVIATVFSNFEVSCVDRLEDIVEINIFPVKWRNARMKLTPLTSAS
jgi:hypothetical protein